MVLQEIQLMLKDGKLCSLNSGVADDSRKIAAFFEEMASQSTYTERTADEMPNVYEARKILQWFEAMERGTMVLAWVRKRIVGCAVLRALYPYEKTSHRCSMRIGVLPEYRRLGVGSALARRIFQSAAKQGYEYMEAEVIVKNLPAVALYEKLGFHIVVTRENAYKQEDGTYVAAHLMERILENRIMLG